MEGLRTGPSSQCKAARNILEQKAERLALFLCFGDQHRAKHRVGNCRGSLNDQIALPSDGAVARSFPAVAIGRLEAGNRRARHQEILQDSFINDGDLLSGDAIVVEFVVTVQIHAIHAFRRWVIHD